MFRRLLFAFLALVPLVFSYTSILSTGATECYHEYLKKSDHFSISYEVVGKYNINFILRNANNIVIVDRRESPEGNFGTTAADSGKFSFCFTNPSQHGIVVNFNPHSPEEEVFLNKIESTEDIKKEMRSLSHNVEDVIDHFVFMFSRSEENEKVIYKLQSRVFWWATLQSITLISVCGWQVYYVTSIFKARGVV
ncbi:hypothetical protein BB561_001905 [Smittium simulii]|uniref:GOLD domain-containing protein n=1 Tax=Smittium simulii TaxID=133385 RepID=A0A2T9YSJ1_9FUNG|nr:hypothetical protein BB561_001905 [Smittium simulii]